MMLFTSCADNAYECEPAVLTAMHKAKLHYKNWYKFETTSFLKTQPTSLVKLWEMNTSSFENMFAELAVKKPWSKTLSESELLEQEQLEVKIENLHPLLRALLSKTDELLIMNDVKKTMGVEPNTENRTVTVVVTKRRVVHFVNGSNSCVTTCLKCMLTCHNLCRINEDASIFNCVVMCHKPEDYGTTDAKCATCINGECSWDDHKSTPYRLEMYQEPMTRTYAQIKENGSAKTTNKDENSDTFLYGINEVDELNEEDDDDLKKGLSYIINMIRKSINRLQEIARNPDPCTQEEFIQHLIENEEREGKVGWKGRVKVLKILPTTPPPDDDA